MKKLWTALKGKKTKRYPGSLVDTDSIEWFTIVLFVSSDIYLLHKHRESLNEACNYTAIHHNRSQYTFIQN